MRKIKNSEYISFINHMNTLNENILSAVADAEAEVEKMKNNPDNVQAKIVFKYSEPIASISAANPSEIVADCAKEIKDNNSIPLPTSAAISTAYKIMVDKDIKSDDDTSGVADIFGDKKNFDIPKKDDGEYNVTFNDEGKVTAMKNLASMQNYIQESHSLENDEKYTKFCAALVKAI